MVITNLAQSLQIALGRYETARGTCNGLNDAGRYRIGAVVHCDTQQVFSKIKPLIRLSLDEAVFRKPGMAHVHHSRNPRAKRLAVFNHAAQRHACHIDTVIRPLTRDEALALPLASSVVVRVNNFHRCVDCFRAGVAEEDMVKPFRGQFRHPASKLKRQRLGQLKRRYVRRGL